MGHRAVAEVHAPLHDNPTLHCHVGRQLCTEFSLLSQNSRYTTHLSHLASIARRVPAALSASLPTTLSSVLVRPVS